MTYQNFLDWAGQFWGAPLTSDWLQILLIVLCSSAVLMNLAILRASNLFSVRLKESTRQLFIIGYLLLGLRMVWLTWFDPHTPVPFASILSLLMVALGVNFEAFVEIMRLQVQDTDVERQLCKTGQMKMIRHGRRG